MNNDPPKPSPAPTAATTARLRFCPFCGADCGVSSAPQQVECIECARQFPSTALRMFSARHRFLIPVWLLWGLLPCTLAIAGRLVNFRISFSWSVVAPVLFIVLIVVPGSWGYATTRFLKGRVPLSEVVAWASSILFVNFVLTVLFQIFVSLVQW